MNTHDDKHSADRDRADEVKLTPDEKKAFEQLPREHVPGKQLEDRIVSSLRQRGILKDPRRRVIEVNAWRIAAAAAACVVLILAGFILGTWSSSTQFTRNDLPITERDEFSVAASLQQAGSAYLLSLERLASLPDSVDGEEAAQGREIAVATLSAAVDRVAGLVPRNTLADRLLTSLKGESNIWAAGAASEITIEGNRVIEF